MFIKRPAENVILDIPLLVLCFLKIQNSSSRCDFLFLWFSSTSMNCSRKVLVQVIQHHLWNIIICLIHQPNYRWFLESSCRATSANFFDFKFTWKTRIHRRIKMVSRNVSPDFWTFFNGRDVNENNARNA